MNEKILYVDDDTNILAACWRNLHKRFSVDTASSGAEGLKAVETRGPYAVVVSDLRMPGMDGIEFLARVREKVPDTVRVMLTGHAEIETAIAVVNQGNIFRFLTKPVQAEVLVSTLEASLAQYRLVIAERELLEKTLKGCIKVLTEVLALADPVAFSRAVRLKRYVQHIAPRLDLPDQWQFEVAAMLSQIGCVALSHGTLEKAHAGRGMTAEEERLFVSHPAIAGEILSRVPRLECVARMIAGQQDPLKEADCAVEPKRRDMDALGAQILKVAIAFDQFVAHGAPVEYALLELRKRPKEWDPAIVAALVDIQLAPEGVEARILSTRGVDVGMIVNEDLRGKDGGLLLPRGQEVTYPVLQWLRSFSQEGGAKDPFLVLAPRRPDGEGAAE